MDYHPSSLWHPVGPYSCHWSVMLLAESGVTLLEDLSKATVHGFWSRDSDHSRCKETGSYCHWLGSSSGCSATDMEQTQINRATSFIYHLFDFCVNLKAEQRLMSLRVAPCSTLFCPPNPTESLLHRTSMQGLMWGAMDLQQCNSWEYIMFRLYTAVHYYIIHSMDTLGQIF